MWVIEFLTYAPLGLVLIYCVLIYNGLVRLKNNVAKSFANIEVLLKQRHAELPRLAEICKGIMTHERNLFASLAKARERVDLAQEEKDVKALGRAETEIRQAVHQVFLRAEAYPELKANENMLALQERIIALEDAIADRRELFNESVQLNNTRIEQLPDVFFASLFDFGAFEYLKFEDEAIEPIAIAGIYD